MLEKYRSSVLFELVKTSKHITTVITVGVKAIERCDRMRKRKKFKTRAEKFYNAETAFWLH